MFSGSTNHALLLLASLLDDARLGHESHPHHRRLSIRAWLCSVEARVVGSTEPTIGM